MAPRDKTKKLGPKAFERRQEEAIQRVKSVFAKPDKFEKKISNLKHWEENTSSAGPVRNIRNTLREIKKTGEISAKWLQNIRSNLVAAWAMVPASEKLPQPIRKPPGSKDLVWYNAMVRELMAAAEMKPQRFDYFTEAKSHKPNGEKRDLVVFINMLISQMQEDADGKDSLSLPPSVHDTNNENDNESGDEDDQEDGEGDGEEDDEENGKEDDEEDDKKDGNVTPFFASPATPDKKRPGEDISPSVKVIKVSSNTSPAESFPRSGSTGPSRPHGEDRAGSTSMQSLPASIGQISPTATLQRIGKSSLSRPHGEDRARGASVQFSPAPPGQITTSSILHNPVMPSPMGFVSEQQYLQAKDRARDFARRNQELLADINKRDEKIKDLQEDLAKTELKYKEELNKNIGMQEQIAALEDKLEAAEAVQQIHSGVMHVASQMHAMQGEANQTLAFLHRGGVDISRADADANGSNLLVGAGQAGGALAEENDFQGMEDNTGDDGLNGAEDYRRARSQSPPLPKLE